MLGRNIGGRLTGRGIPCTRSKGSGEVEGRGEGKGGREMLRADVFERRA